MSDRIEDRIKVETYVSPWGEVVDGWLFDSDELAEYGKDELIKNKAGYKLEDPFTNIKHDYNVLFNFQDCKDGFLWYAFCGELEAVNGGLQCQYRIGDYARACLKVANKYPNQDEWDNYAGDPMDAYEAAIAEPPYVVGAKDAPLSRKAQLDLVMKEALQEKHPDRTYD